MKRILLALFASVLFLGLLAYPLSRKAFAQESEPEHEDQDQSDEQSSQALSDDEPQDQEEPDVADSDDTQAEDDDDQGAVEDEPSQESETEDQDAGADTQADTDDSGEAADSNDTQDDQQQEQGTVEDEPSNEPDAEDSAASPDTEADTDESGEAADSNETPEDQQQEQGTAEDEPSEEPAAEDSPTSAEEKSDEATNPSEGPAEATTPSEGPPAEATTPSEGPPAENTAATQPASEKQEIEAFYNSLNKEQQIGVKFFGEATKNLEKYKLFVKNFPEFDPDLLEGSCRVMNNGADCKLAVLEGAFAYQIIQSGEKGWDETSQTYQKMQAYANRKPPCNSKEECDAYYRNVFWKAIANLPKTAYFDKKAIANLPKTAAKNGQRASAQSSPGGLPPLPDLGLTPEESAEINNRLDEYIKKQSGPRVWDPYQVESDCMKQPKATELLCQGLVFMGYPFKILFTGQATKEELAKQNEWIKTHPTFGKKLEDPEGQMLIEQLKEFLAAKPKQ